MKPTLTEISKILKDKYGINSKNTYPKTILHEPSGEAYIACYPKEMKSDFYYYDDENSHMYVHPVKEDYKPLYDTEEYGGALKYKVPFSCFDFVEELKKETKNEELQDFPLSEVTALDLLAVLYKVPVSKKETINKFIKQYLTPDIQ